jgi:hypothetical protein
MNERLLHLPQLSPLDLGLFRSPGPGLGNLLFPIGRALIGAARHGGELVYPTMRQLKVGTYLRGERDKRTYGDVLRRRSAADWRQWLATRLSPRIEEVDFDGSQRGTVVYSGLRGYFHDLAGHEAEMSRWLAANLRDATDAVPCDIAVHVRLGDFSATDPAAGGNSIRQPLEWYRDAIVEARRLLGGTGHRIVVFTDGDPDDVVAGLGAGAVEVDPGVNALGAILRLSRGRARVGSRSTFSMWGAFLGGMPAVWDRRYEARTRTLPERGGLDHVL